jgi:hypothetical protein
MATPKKTLSRVRVSVEYGHLIIGPKKKPIRLPNSCRVAAAQI